MVSREEPKTARQSGGREHDRPAAGRRHVLLVSLTDPNPVTVAIGVSDNAFAQALGDRLAMEPDIVVVGLGGTFAEVVQIADKRHPGLVLLDEKLPYGNGVASIATLKQAHRSLQVVLLTSFEDQDALVAALEAGASGFLKRGDPGVADAIRRVMDGHALITPLLLTQLVSRITPTFAAGGPTLSARDVEILDLAACGISDASIAQRLEQPAENIQTYIQGIVENLGARTRLEAIVRAVQLGVVRRP